MSCIDASYGQPMNELQVNIVGTTGAGARLLVLVHGYGADEFDLAGLVPHIDPHGRFFTVCPRGPRSVMGFGAGWYERNDDGTIDSAMFLSSVDALDITINRACADGGFDRAEAVIIGFSQGGAMTLASALRTPGATRPAAMACLSGMLTELDGLEYGFENSTSSDSMPEILIHHGTLDPMVIVDRGQAIRDTLTTHGVEHTYREYPMQHEISMASMHDLRDWLARLI
jgi:phospholipase/carboxylesterase